MTRHTSVATSAASQIVFLEERHRKIVEHSPGTSSRRALEHNIETNESIADRIEREHAITPADTATASDSRA